MQFIISETDEVLVPQAGLAVVGALLGDTAIKRRLSAIELEDCPRPEIKHGEVVTAAIGLLCLGKSDYTDIEAFRSDGFFRRALGLGKVPSEETLRQRLDQLGTLPQAILHEESAAMVKRHVRKLTCCYGDWVPLDLDVSPFDNSGTKKEGVSWTYKGMDGYAPNFGYLGVEGYLVHCELRPGKQLRERAGLPEAEGRLDHQTEPPQGVAGGLAGGGPGLRGLGIPAGRQGGLHGRDVAGAGRQAPARGVPCDVSDDRRQGAAALGAGDRSEHVVDDPEAAGESGDRTVPRPWHQRAVPRRRGFSAVGCGA